MSRRILVLAALLSLTLVGCRKKPDPAPTQGDAVTASTKIEQATMPAPRRIVLFIGDGMGIGHLTAAGYAKGEPLGFVQMPYAGLMTTHEYEFLSTDSAASATAISTGRKTHYQGVSVVPGTTKETQDDPANHMQTLMELASENGLRTGLVATSRITHATPAAFGAHAFHRHEYERVAAQYAAGDLDVLIGAGTRHFEQREDGVNLFDTMREDGWYIAKTADELNAAPNDALRVAGLMHDKDMPFLIDDEARAMPLPDMVSTAIDVLDRGNPKGWVLMVEGSFVDWCAHDLDAACAAVETIDLDAAVARARDYASDRDDTLVIVTADHETGGVSVLDPYYSNRFSKILGGEEAAAKIVDEPAEGAEPPPFQHIAIGAASAELYDEPLPAPAREDMSEYTDGRASLVLGYFSMASRAYWKQDGRFYGAHSPTPVTIHAEGPGARQVTRARDNADLGQAIRELVVQGATDEPIAADVQFIVPPKNVILLIGDGMGVSSVGGAYYWNGGLRMMEIADFGVVTTHAVDYLVNDSAATATAMATGFRSKKKAVGNVWKDGKLQPSPSVLERAEAVGKATGIVTTTAFTHATPAAFYAHQDQRYETAPIVADFVSMPQRIDGSDGVDVFVAGGQKNLDDATKQQLIAAGYTLADSWPTEPADKLLATLAEDGLAPATLRLNDDDPGTPTLQEMTTFALDRLQQDEDGFFLLVEGGQIDWRLHEGRHNASIFAEVVDFDGAVGAALDFAAEYPDTLVIVTSDHDHTMTLLDNHYAFESGRCGMEQACGGPEELQRLPIATEGIRNGEGLTKTELQGEYAPPTLIVNYAWPVEAAKQREDVSASHSANMVPIFTQGPWSHRFRGYLDQPQIGQILLEWAETERPAVE